MQALGLAAEQGRCQPIQTKSCTIYSSLAALVPGGDSYIRGRQALLGHFVLSWVMYEA